MNDEASMDLRERIALAIEAFAAEIRGDLAVYDELAIAKADVAFRAARIAREMPIDDADPNEDARDPA